MNGHALPIGTSLRDNGYTIEQVLGQGGFGITYRAVDQLGRPVAIKEFYPANFCFRQEQRLVKMPGYTGVFDFEKYRDEFFNEARTLTKFDHPNIVKILDAFTGNNTAYFVMPFEEGQTLQDILASKVHLSESETLKYMKEVAHALEYIHKQGTLHRDIKPSNIIIRKNGKPILIDFGAARQLVHGNEEHTAILSHGFAPPEQYDKNGKKGHFIDVYGLCATCYYCLTGSVPIRADHRSTQLMPEPNAINPKISDQLNEIIVKGLELASDKRYQSVSKLLYDLTSVSAAEDEDYELIDSQKNGLDVINQFVSDDQTNALILTGAINTGKTTIVKKFLAKATHSKLAVKLLTVGSRIAEELVRRDGLEAYSIYKHIYNFTSASNSKPGNDNIDLEKGEVSESDIKRVHYSVKSNPDGEEVIYIIEEAQLLSDSFSENELFIFGSGKLLNDLIHYIDFAKHPKRKLLIVGDDKRLSRGSSDESALSKTHLSDTYRLAVKVFELSDIIITDQQRSIERFNESGFAGFEDPPNPEGRPSTLSSKQIREMIKIALARPTEGVIKDFHWNSLKTGNVPIILLPHEILNHTFSIRLSTTDYRGAVSRVETLFAAAFPGNPIEYFFLDEFFNSKYRDDQNFGKIFASFGTLAIIIACLGLLGLTAFNTDKKLREISIRKVLGASPGNITALLSRDLLEVVAIAGIISLPVVWYAASGWLNAFAFRIELTWDIFTLPILALTVICLLTVTTHILRGISVNPAKVLKSE